MILIAPEGLQSIFLTFLHLFTLWARYYSYYHPHLTDDETKAESLSFLPMVAQLVSLKRRRLTQVLADPKTNAFSTTPYWMVSKVLPTLPA